MNHWFGPNLGLDRTLAVEAFAHLAPYSVGARPICESFPLVMVTKEAAAADTCCMPINS